MDIKGKVHCFFEQSGTFKNEFIKLGIPAEDYDIQNNFNQTDHVIDLFHEIETAYEGGVSLFDSITCDDLIIAFFPCIYFQNTQMMYYQLTNKNNMHKDMCGRIDDAIDRLHKRTQFHILLYQLTWVCCKRKIRLIIENPYSPIGYLFAIQNFVNPTIIDKNRALRGDYFVKPTAFWFFNCEPTNGYSFQPNNKIKTVDKCKSSQQAGVCSEERSMISPDYARNFICDFIIGKVQKHTQLTLWN